ncbi:hypothetical protein [Glutamicibacter halophytocola]|uniref:hypothetical protein n=1 Tax=Glutamicibacter halophytocola TaxID=1933880 RepID=UPI003AAD8C85
MFNIFAFLVEFKDDPIRERANAILAAVPAHGSTGGHPSSLSLTSFALQSDFTGSMT